MFVKLDKWKPKTGFDLKKILIIQLKLKALKMGLFISLKI